MATHSQGYDNRGGGDRSGDGEGRAGGLAGLEPAADVRIGHLVQRRRRARAVGAVDEGSSETALDRWPARPRNSRIAAVSAVSVSRSAPGMVVESQEIVPVAVGYNPRIALSTATGAVQLVSECKDSGDEVQANPALL